MSQACLVNKLAFENWIKRGADVENLNEWRRLYQVFKSHTMVWEPVFWMNLELCQKYHQQGKPVVECGVWKGGMIAAIAAALNDPLTNFHLFDSFEGLPQAKKIDGKAAIAWQQDKDSPGYFDNCRATIEDVREAVMLAQSKNVTIHEGWFSETMTSLDQIQEISILRLDADWYDSTMICLENLYPKVISGGIIIIDDYYTWEGCSRAVHDYLSGNGISDRIRSAEYDVAYIRKA